MRFGPRRVACVVFLLALGSSLPASRAQFRLDGLATEEAELPVESDPRDELRARLDAAARGYEDRASRMEERTRYALERIEARRAAIDKQEREFDRRLRALRFADPDRTEVAGRVLAGLRELADLLAQLETVQETVLDSLYDAVGETRAVRLSLDRGLDYEAEKTSAGVDRRIEEIDVRLARLAVRAEDLDRELQAARERLEDHRARVVVARKRVFEQPAVPAIRPPEPTPAPEEAIPSADGESESVPEAPTPPEIPVLSAAELELMDLMEEEQRVELRRIERQVEVDRLRLQGMEVPRDLLDLRVAAEQLLRDAWIERREVVALNEAGGLLNLAPGGLDPEAYHLAGRQARHIAADPGGALDAFRARIRGPGGSRSTLFGVFLLGLLSFVLGRRVREPLLQWPPDDVGEELSRAALLRVLPLLPVTLVCEALRWADWVPDALQDLFRFAAFAPPLAAAAVATADVLFSSPRAVTEASGRSLRVLVRVGAGLALLGLLASTLLPQLGFDEAVQVRLQQLVLGGLLLIWLLICLQRDELLHALGADGDRATVGAIRSGIRSLYRFFSLGPAAVYLLYFVGYQNLGRFLIRGGSVTLAVLLFAPWVYGRLSTLLQRSVGYPDGGGWLGLQQDSSRAVFRATAPTLWIVVGGASLALMASGWGYGELFTNLSEAIRRPLMDIGGSRISVGSLLLLSITLALTYLFARWVLSLLRNTVYPLYELDRGTSAVVDAVARYSIMGFGTILGLDVVGVGTGFLTVFAGVVGIGVGFGSQTLASNFIAGLILLASRPVSVDSVVDVGGLVGRVERIKTFYTVVRTLDNLRVIVPNSELVSSVVTNWNVDEPEVRLHVVLGVAYGSDTGVVRDLMLRAAKEHPAVLRRPAPTARFDDFGDSALIFTLLVWTTQLDRREDIASDLRFTLDRLCREAGVEIPFPQRDLHLRTGDGTLSLAVQQGWEVRDDAGAVLVPGDVDVQKDRASAKG